MYIIFLICLSCAVFAYGDVDVKTGPDGCEPVSLTAKKTGRKAWDKCVEYQQTLVYPCEQTKAGGLSRVSHCQQKRDTLVLESSPPVRHMALIGFGDEDQSKIKWQCAATLLSEKFVLGAAHCTRTFDDIAKYVKIDIQQLDDKQGKVHKIKTIIAHPEYKPPSRYNDIALYELEEPVQLNKDIVPACLPVGDDLNDDTASHSYWELETNLQTRTLNKLSYEECAALYPPHRQLNNGINDTTQMCYEEKNGDKEECWGIRGGPLQVLNTKVDCMHTLIGISSFGRPACLSHSDAYTRVAAYVPWIESVVWP